MDGDRVPRFWELVRRVGAEGRRLGLEVPGFRSPPRTPGALRTVSRPPGGAVVAVAWRDRSPADVVGDLVDGLVLVNGLAGAEAADCRRSLRSALAGAAGGGPPVPAGGGGPARAGRTRLAWVG